MIKNLGESKLLYPLCQFAGWSLFISQYYFLQNVIRNAPPLLSYWLVVYFCFGILISHYVLRPYLRWQNSIVCGLWKKIFLVFLLVCSLALIQISLTSYIIYFDTLIESLHYVSLFDYVTVLQVTIFAYLVWSAGYSFWINWKTQRREKLRLLNLEVELRNTQYESLKQKLNPDFIFQSLKTISLLAADDREVARDMITNLSNLLRYSLYQGKENTVSLAEEIAIVQEYLFIERQSFGERLHINWQIDNHLADIPVIPLCLHTLVEIAIRNGNDNRCSVINIDIKAEKRGNGIMLSVKSHGAINAANKVDSGINFIRQRLSLVFGELASLEYQSLSEQAVLATVRLPILKS